MNREDTIRMAREAGVYSGANEMVFAASIERFFQAAYAAGAAAEREACAKVCDSLEEQCEKLLVPDEKWPTPADCANIIRARRMNDENN